MGMNASAIVAFGIVLGDEIPESIRGNDEEDAFEFEEFIAEISGLKRPETDNYDDKAWTDYWAAKRKAEANFPVVLKRTASYEYAEWVLAVNGSVQSADWGSAAELEVRKLAERDVKGFKEFCSKYGIEGQPKWILAAFYG